MPREVTRLSPAEESQFQTWARANRVPNEDGNFGFYDMRGYWKNVVQRGGNETAINAQDGLLHYPDTYKQHGHPTFSAESQYSRGLQDGGRWIGDTLVAPPLASHAQGISPQVLQMLMSAMKER